MKKLFSLIILVTIITSCCNNKDTIIYNFTTDEKAFVPYEKQTVIKWEDNTGAVFNGIVSEKTSRMSEISDQDCKEIIGESSEIRFTIDDSIYTVSLNKWDNSRIDLIVSPNNTIQNNDISFYKSFLNINDFGTVNFNGEVFENSIKINGNVPNNTLIYSKTNGIEFILFADGTWYKRVE
ncbi:MULTISPECIES: hypothetical protein [unclassified Flavobacterium]|uniref:hypothetical protein n=1 Tax=unclassified Flavobacterium TaxID=196869 RepID=UPI0013D85602|nr:MULTISPECIES: hypothetical protein [unclassified Flavobacterium]MBA5792388.1 hypothetical protein [Flavobacterium sp. xlx-221]